MKRKNQETSIDAWKSLSKEQISETQQSIVFALKNMAQGGTSHMIAAVLKKPEEKIRKRLSELERLGLIFKPGHCLNSPSGRACYVWQIKQNSTQVESHPTPIIGIRQFSDAIERIKQQTLF